MSIHHVKNSGHLVNTNASAEVEMSKADKTARKNVTNSYAKAAPPVGVTEAANVQISPRAKELSMAKKILSEIPDVRDDKVTRYQELLAQGAYRPNSEKIANGILHEAMRDEIAKDPSIILS
jgi:flagellar biosynthesis anti-sigma factor FlgM